MQTTNIIGPIDQNTWNALRNAKAVIKLFMESGNQEGLSRYLNIYQATLKEVA